MKVPEPDPIIGGVVDTYRVPKDGLPDASAEVFVVDQDGIGKYLVRLPKLDAVERGAFELLRKNLLDSIPVATTGTAREIVGDYMHRVATGTGIQDVVRESGGKLLYYLLKEFLGFWEVEPLMNDDKIEEISVTRFDKPVRVLHRDFSEYSFIETDITYASEERLQAFVWFGANLGSFQLEFAGSASDTANVAADSVIVVSKAG